MLTLSNVALISICSTHIKETYRAIKHSISQVNFGQVIVYTDKPDNTLCDIKSNIISPLTSFREYQHFIVKKMPEVVLPDLNQDITHVLQINWDGFVVNGEAWMTDFLNYDYIGAPWVNWNTVGNGGFVLKSKKFLEIQKQIHHRFKLSVMPEDLALCVCLKRDFIEKDCKYSPIDLAYKFSVEEGNYNDHMSFGFHNLERHPQFKKYIQYEN